MRFDKYSTAYVILPAAEVSQRLLNLSTAKSLAAASRLSSGEVLLEIYTPVPEECLVHPLLTPPEAANLMVEDTNNPELSLWDKLAAWWVG